MKNLRGCCWFFLLALHPLQIGSLQRLDDRSLNYPCLRLWSSITRCFCFIRGILLKSFQLPTKIGVAFAENLKWQTQFSIEGWTLAPKPRPGLRSCPFRVLQGPRRHLCRNAFFSVKCWNRLPGYIVTTPSVGSFNGRGMSCYPYLNYINAWLFCAPTCGLYVVIELLCEFQSVA